ncbi:hypothetical protein C7S20_03105 [Christiangramia fulva]|uniref:Outer membrane protein n=1 Tax=Christiangramia fulva TaxID=2126553 RepID=A0A2R3Z229_9FLAO|nr:hypothetical protein [Christiangramia fulva]AVR44327.1 hypothetical protein C7S20_03105 [Christiangramia fulva]
MIKRFIVIVAFFSALFAEAQENVSSPYSYYGIGITNFKGTVANRSMGGLNIYNDSIHINLMNPAAYGRLRLTNYAIGASHDRISLKSDVASDNAKISSLDYLALGLPLGDGLGIGVGLIPYTSVGYRIVDFQDNTASRLYGRGGMNKVFLSAGYQINNHFSLGVDASYNFGNFQNRRTVVRDGIQLGTRDINRSDIKGFNFNFGAEYRTDISEDLELSFSGTYSPAIDLNSDNFREVSTISFLNGSEIVVDKQEIDVENSNFTYPSRLIIGGGIGKRNNWFIGAEYVNVGASSYQDSFSFRNDGGQFEDASQFKIGGFYIPEFDSYTSYFKRVVYRAGFRYEGTGLIVNDTSIKEFGISFGLGLPVGLSSRDPFSNINLGFELGQRGTKDAGLIEENYLKLSIGLSLNDKWFTKRKFN